MKAIFLDFDGVLNYKVFFGRAERKDPPTKAERRAAQRLQACLKPIKYPSALAIYDLRSLDQDRVALVKQLVDRTGAKIVVSSSWRHGQTIPGLRILLGYYGLDPCCIIDVTPSYAELPPQEDPVRRGHEIQAWLDVHPEVARFVILDDDSDMVHLMDHLVQTSADTGLTPADVEAAIRILESP